MNVFEFLLKMKCLYQLTLYNPLFAHVYGLNEFFFFHSSECAWLIFNMNITIPNNSYNHYLASIMGAHFNANAHKSWLTSVPKCMQLATVIMCAMHKFIGAFENLPDKHPVCHSVASHYQIPLFVWYGVAYYGIVRVGDMCEYNEWILNAI